MANRLIGTLAGLCVCFAAGAQSGDFVAQANNLYRTITPNLRSDSILLPVLADLMPPPASISSDRLRYVSTSSKLWPDLENWAMAAPQRAALEAFARATEDTKPLPMGFGLPYGASEAAPELISAGLYVELGDPPLLARADFKYMPALDTLVYLTEVEVTRLADAGQFLEAFDVLRRRITFGRQMADREFIAEADWGIRTMIGALERMRDVAYVDFQSGKPVLTNADLINIIAQLNDDAGFLSVDRISFPEGERIAAEQVVALTFANRGGANDQFTRTMAALGSSRFPLRLFSESGRWESLRPFHADWFDTTANIAKVAGDWKARWSLGAYDPQLITPQFITRLDPRRDAAVIALYDAPYDDLVADRIALRTELKGTRTALGILGYYYGQRTFPPSISAIRPRYVNVLDDDPMNKDRAFGKSPPFEYFVPNKVNAIPIGLREEPRPHVINVVTSDKANFSVQIDSDQFILYSLGPDSAKDWARNVREDIRAFFTGDYLIWPPVVSLHREHLRQAGQLP